MIIRLQDQEGLKGWEEVENLPAEEQLQPTRTPGGARGEGREVMTSLDQERVPDIRGTDSDSRISVKERHK